MQNTLTTSADGTDHAPPAPDQDDHYEAFLASVRDKFAHAVRGGTPLFTTNVAEHGDLFDAFLGELPADRRQHYTCRACRAFVNRYGGLVTISADGIAMSALWHPGTVPDFFVTAVAVLAGMVRRSKVTGVFLSKDPEWGTVSNTGVKPPGEWFHLAVQPPFSMLHRSVLLSAEQKMAERKEEHGMLQRGLADFPIEVVRKAHALLTTGALNRSEKHIGAAKWLLDLHEARAGAKRREDIADNLVWLTVALAPAGFAHVRSGMLGTLLEDVAEGLPIEAIKRRFDEKMRGDLYQRPQAPPAAGNIAAAEAIVEKLGLKAALPRRFAKLEDVQAMWTPKPVAPAAPAEGGVFGHLTPKGAAPVLKRDTLPVQTMTWVKFQAVVLPTAESIALEVPSGMAAFAALVTAVDPAAPPILQWDREDDRNPMSWYQYVGGSPASVWNLTEGTWVDVTAITLQPSMWGDPAAFSHQGQKVFFLLKGARDIRHRNGGGLFPETLKAEFHAVRATLEAYSNAAPIADRDEATACGLAFQAGGRFSNALIRVKSQGVEMLYQLDRWD